MKPRIRIKYLSDESSEVTISAIGYFKKHITHHFKEQLNASISATIEYLYQDYLNHFEELRAVHHLQSQR